MLASIFIISGGREEKNVIFLCQKVNQWEIDALIKMYDTSFRDQNLQEIYSHHSLGNLPSSDSYNKLDGYQLPRPNTLTLSGFTRACVSSVSYMWYTTFQHALASPKIILQFNNFSSKLVIPYSNYLSYFKAIKPNYFYCTLLERDHVVFVTYISSKRTIYI